MKAIEKYHSVREVSWLLGFAAATIRSMAKSGDFGAAIQVGADIRVPASGINAWIDRHRIDQTNPGRRRRQVAILKVKPESGEEL